MKRDTDILDGINTERGILIPSLYQKYMALKLYSGVITLVAFVSIILAWGFWSR